MKTSGFNFQDLAEDNKNMGEIIDMGENKYMMDDKPRKKKVKFNFDNLFPKPKDAKKDMGMGNICEGEPFEGIL